MIPLIMASEAQKAAAAASRQTQAAELGEARNKLWELSRRFGGGTVVGLHIEAAWRSMGFAIQQFEEPTG